MKISIKYNNAECSGDNATLQEVGIDKLYSVEEIRDYFFETGEINPDDVTFEDGTDEEVNAWLHLKELAEEGDIYHDILTGEEWIGIGGTAEIYLCEGKTEYWAKSLKVHDRMGGWDDDEIFTSPKNWEPLEESISIDRVEIPDGQGGFSDTMCFIQKNENVDNPINDFPGWMDDFRLERMADGVFCTKK